MKKLTAFFMAAAMAASGLTTFAADGLTSRSGQGSTQEKLSQSVTTAAPTSGQEDETVTSTPIPTSAPTALPTSPPTESPSLTPDPVYVIKNGSGSCVLLNYLDGNFSAEKMITQSTKAVTELVNIDDSNYIPFRYLFEKFGFKEAEASEINNAAGNVFAWEFDENERVNIEVKMSGNKSEKFISGEEIKTKEGKSLGECRVFEDGSTYLPIRALELFDVDVKYDEETDAIYISTSSQKKLREAVDESKEQYEAKAKEVKDTQVIYDGMKTDFNMKKEAYDRIQQTPTPSSSPEAGSVKTTATNPPEKLIDFEKLKKEYDDAKTKFEDAKKILEDKKSELNSIEEVYKNNQAKLNQARDLMGEDKSAGAVQKAYRSLFNDNYASYAYAYVPQPGATPAPLTDDRGNRCYCVNQYGDMLVYMDSEKRICVKMLGGDTDKLPVTLSDNSEEFLAVRVIYDGRNIYGVKLENKDAAAGKIFAATLGLNEDGNFIMKDIKYLEGSSTNYILHKTMKENVSYKRYLYYTDYYDLDKVKRIDLSLSETPETIKYENGELKYISNFNISGDYIMYSKYRADDNANPNAIKSYGNIGNFCAKFAPENGTQVIHLDYYGNGNEVRGIITNTAEEKSSSFDDRDKIVSNNFYIITESKITDENSHEGKMKGVIKKVKITNGEIELKQRDVGEEPQQIRNLAFINGALYGRIINGASCVEVKF